MYPEQCGVISAHHTRINGKIPDFTIAREGGVTESVDYTIATVLAYACDANLEPVAGNREHADIDPGVGIKIFKAKKKTKSPHKTPPLSSSSS